MDLSTKTPVEIDTALAEIYGRLYTVRHQIDQNQKWAADLADGIAKKEAGDPKYLYYSTDRLDALLATINNLEVSYSDIYQETIPYESEYRSRPWSRFFLVKNNGGHIHSSMSCSTCYITTEFGWLPNLSGQTEAEAVAEHGAILCTVCYPSAPVEYTDRRDPSACAGSGAYYDSSLPHRKGYAYGNWAECPECHTNQTLTKGMKIKKHKK